MPDHRQAAQLKQPTTGRCFLWHRATLFAAWLIATAAVPALAAPVFVDTFDSGQTAWRLERDPAVRPIEQLRTRVDQGEEEAGVELIRYTCRPGYAARCWLPLGRVPVIDETRLSITLRCELPGVVFAARVVMPRVIDPQTGQPQTVVIRGDRYEQPNAWRTLTLAGAPQLVADAARLLRSQPGAGKINERGAYVDRAMLILPGTERGASLWTDNLEVHGVLLAPSAEQHGPATTENDPAGITLPELTNKQPTAKTLAIQSPATEENRVTLDASGFTIAGKPFFPRIWTHAGGALQAIRDSGFNTVAFNNPPNPTQLTEAARLKLRVICPPPTAEEIAPDTWRPVLAWMVNQGSDSIDAASAFAEQIRDASPALDRPLLATPAGDWSRWSRVADGLVIARHGPPTPAGDRLWTDRATSIALLARPGTPLLHRIDATLTPEAARQLAVFVSTPAPITHQDTQRLASDVWSAIARRSTGVWINAGQKLSGADARTLRLRRALTLLNIQLGLIEPWLAGGDRGPVLADATGMPRAALFKRGRVRLLTPAGSANSTSNRSGSASHLVVPGIGSSAQAFQLTSASVTPLKTDRIAGGVRIDADAVSLDHLVIFTDDRQSVSTIANRAAKTARSAARIAQQLARDELADRTASAPIGRQTSTDPVRRAAEQRISVATAAAAAGNARQAYDSAMEARRQLAASPKTQPLAPLRRTPLALTPSHRTAEQRLNELLAAAPRGVNLLAGGNFESLAATRQAGWTNTTLPLETITTAAELSATRPAHGQKCLQLSSTPEEGELIPLAAGDCPVWITSPATPLRAGQLVEVTGWVRLEPAAGESLPARVIISDTLGGPQLARVVDDASDWKSFRLLRRAPRDTELRITFGLSGAGAALIDAVMIRPVQVGVTPPPPARLAPASPIAAKPPVAAQPTDAQAK